MEYVSEAVGIEELLRVTRAARVTTPNAKPTGARDAPPLEPEQQRPGNERGDDCNRRCNSTARCDAATLNLVIHPRPSLRDHGSESICFHGVIETWPLLSGGSLAVVHRCGRIQ